MPGEEVRSSSRIEQKVVTQRSLIQAGEVMLAPQSQWVARNHHSEGLVEELEGTLAWVTPVECTAAGRLDPWGFSPPGSQLTRDDWRRRQGHFEGVGQFELHSGRTGEELWALVVAVE